VVKPASAEKEREAEFNHAAANGLIISKGPGCLRASNRTPTFCNFCRELHAEDLDHWLGRNCESAC
jgi:hypothetical protein